MGRPNRAAPERQRSFQQEAEAVKVPAQQSGAACPTGAVTAGDWGWTDRISVAGPNRAAPERQRSFQQEAEAVKVPAQQSGAACPTGAVTAGDWGWTDRISYRNPVINDKILIFNIILLNINSSN